MKEKLNSIKCINALELKIFAMFCMLLDHTWAMLPNTGEWMTVIGRLAFPIFAFQIVEGYKHTSDIKKYLKRLLVFALISEIPFNYLTANGPINPFNQNVLFTFILGLLIIMLLEKAKAKNAALYIITILLSIVGGFLVGTFTFVDYQGYGILMILAFYLFYDKKFGWVPLLLAMLYINCEMIGGVVYPTTLFGREILIPQQGMAVLALIPIYLYNGKQGLHNKKIQYACYAFYPAHITILVIIALIIAHLNGF